MKAIRGIVFAGVTALALAGCAEQQDVGLGADDRDALLDPGLHEALDGAAVQTITALNAAGIDPLQLPPHVQLGLATACAIAAELVSATRYAQLGGALGAYCPALVLAVGSGSPAVPVPAPR